MDHSEIKEKIYENIKRDNYDISYILEYFNSNILKEIDSKPYLIEFDPIIETLMNQIEYYKNKSRRALGEEKTFYNTKVAYILKILGSYKIESGANIEINTESVDRLVHFYSRKIENNEKLTKKEFKELAYTYLSSFMSGKEVLDYILKNMIENGYKVNNFVYKTLFFIKCKNMLEERGLKDIDIVFISYRDEGPIASYDGKNKIVFNTELVKSINVIDNFISFFHESRHAEEKRDKKPTIRNMMYVKDKILSNIYGRGYYTNNYNDISYERDAFYTSCENVVSFISEIAPASLGKVKNQIKKIVESKQRYMSKDTSEREIPSNKIVADIENINVLCERTLKSKKGFLKPLLSNTKEYVILMHEYHLDGTKKDLFELLENKDKFKDNKELTGFYNYLINDEEVSLNYIVKNAALLFKNKKSKYSKEVENILKKRLIKYQISKKLTRYNDLERDKEFSYDKLKSSLQSDIQKLRKKLLEEYKDSGNRSIYLKTEDELTFGYSELMSIIEENQKKQNFIYFDAEQTNIKKL